MSVVAKGFNMHGEPIELVGSDLLARCVQHETDHLDGIIFIDRLDPEARKEAMKEIRAAEWFGEDTAIKTSPHSLSSKWL
jgi:peptide deformylase